MICEPGIGDQRATAEGRRVWDVWSGLKLDGNLMAVLYAQVDFSDMIVGH